MTGDFHAGGFIWYEKTKPETGRIFWMVGQTPKFDMNASHFPLYRDKVKTLWRKSDPGTTAIMTAIDTKQDYINDIAMFLFIKYGAEFRDFVNNKMAAREKAAAEAAATKKKPAAPPRTAKK
jgi:hypothetical protein